MDTKSPATDYFDLYNRYDGIIRSILVKTGCDYNILNDITNDIYASLIHANALSKYKSRKSEFRTFLTKSVKNAYYNLLKKQKGVNLMTIEESNDDSIMQKGTLYLDLYTGGDYINPETSMIAKDKIDKTFGIIKTDKNLVRVFECLLKGYSIKQISKMSKLSLVTINEQRKYLSELINNM